MKSGTREVRAPDGRRLTVWVEGEGEEFVFVHSGSPEDGSLQAADVEAAAQHELICVGYSRPGYRYSDRHPGRQVVDCAGDVLAIADALAIDSFLTVGWSCGAPHALACAALLLDRVRAVATIASIAPRQASGIEWSRGMGEENREEFGAAEAGSAALQEYLESEAAKWRTAKPDEVPDLFGDRLSDDAREKMTWEEKKIAVDAMQGAVETGIWGWFDDDTASIDDWGFALADIKAPVSIWHGGEDDRFVPSSHGKWLEENIPGAKLHLQHSDSHLSMGGRFGDVLDDLLAKS